MPCVSLADPPVVSIDERACFHCAEPVAPSTHLHVRVDGTERPVCCAGCQAVAEAIVGAGFTSYYELRARPAAPSPSPLSALDARSVDTASLAQSHLMRSGAWGDEAFLLIHGIRCSACAWLNERMLASLPGVRQASVNYSTHRAHVIWDPDRISIDGILAQIQRIGYRAQLYDPAAQEAGLEIEGRGELRRLGVAGLFGMQVMSLAVALYVGADGIEPQYERYFEWLSLVLTLPIVGYAASPFFLGALRGLREGTLGMDLPITLGIGIAFLASVVATVNGAGPVYYDSVAMFVSFLLAARYLHFLARKRNALDVEARTTAIPTLAHRITPHREDEEVVAAWSLIPGDKVLVRPGDVVPADGTVSTGQSCVNESLLPGESEPVRKIPGDGVLAGSANIEGPLTVRVTAASAESVLSKLRELSARAGAERPRIARRADSLAAHFVIGVLMLAGAVAGYWLLNDSEQWLANVIAVLVVSCPCALSLATPTALTAAISGLAAQGVVVAKVDALDKLARASHFVFDKTGTLTDGIYWIASVRTYAHLSADECRQIAASLEHYIGHPVARALEAGWRSERLEVSGFRQVAGAGVSGWIGGAHYFAGKPAYIEEQIGLRWEGDADVTLPQTVILLADEQAILAAFALADGIRADGKPLIDAIRRRGRAVSICSGDRPGSVRAVAEVLGIRDAQGGLSAEEKLARVRSLQSTGKVVAVIGDGLNDTPVLSLADVSIVMGSGAQAAQSGADMVLASNRLGDIGWGVEMACKTRSIIAQNLAWAVAYNLCALPPPPPACSPPGSPRSACP